MTVRTLLFSALPKGLFLVVALAFAVWGASGMVGAMGAGGTGDHVMAADCCGANGHTGDGHSQAPAPGHHQGGKGTCGTVAGHCSIPALGAGAAGVADAPGRNAQVVPLADERVLTRFLDVETPPPRA